MQRQLADTINKTGLDYGSVVRINRTMATHLAQKWKYEHFLLPTWDSPINMDNNLELSSRYFFFGNLINFGLDSETEFLGPVGNTKFWLALRSHPEIFEITNLLCLKEDYFRKIIGSVPYIQKRLEMLKESAQVLRRLYNGKVSELYEANNWNALQILDTIDRYFPAFHDAPCNIPFFRRAKLALFMTHGRFQESNLFSKLGSLSVAADSQVFNGLLHLGLLDVDPVLLDSLKNGLTSLELEVMLRSATILAADLLLEQVNEVRKFKIESCHLDYFLRKSGTNGRVPFSFCSSFAF